MNKVTIKSNKTNPEEPKVKVGQFYIEDTSDEVFILAGLYGKYVLVSLGDGIAWDYPCDDINDVFLDNNDFRLLINDKLEIDIV